MNTHVHIHSMQTQESTEICIDTLWFRWAATSTSPCRAGHDRARVPLSPSRRGEWDPWQGWPDVINLWDMSNTQLTLARLALSNLTEHTSPEGAIGWIWDTSKNSAWTLTFEANSTRKCKNKKNLQRDQILVSIHSIISFSTIYDIFSWKLKFKLIFTPMKGIWHKIIMILFRHSVFTKYDLNS